VAAGVSWRGLVSLVVGLGGLGMCVRTFDGGAEEEASCVDGVLEKHVGGSTGSRCFVDLIHAVGSLRCGEDRA
jgi:hypothetical protein